MASSALVGGLEELLSVIRDHSTEQEENTDGLSPELAASESPSPPMVSFSLGPRRASDLNILCSWFMSSGLQQHYLRT